MIEQKDASKCDEHQVKNKANPLTKKKKGKRHIMMSTQGMKTWKFALVFVVSLMLVVGLFADSVLAQTSRFNVYRPSSVESGGKVRTVEVWFTAEDVIISPGTISVQLPTGWTPVGKPITEEGDPTFGAVDNADDANVLSPTTRMVDSFNPTGGRSKSTDSYVSVELQLVRGTSVTAAAVSVVSATANAEIEVVVTGDMALGDRIKFKFHNVMVQVLETGDETDTAAPGIWQETYYQDDLTVDGDVSGVTKLPFIKVLAPTQSNVDVMPTTAKSGDRVNVIATFEVQSTIADENAIMVTLPDGLVPSDDPTGNYETAEDANALVLADDPDTDVELVTEWYSTTADGMKPDDAQYKSYVSVMYDAATGSKATGASVSITSANVATVTVEGMTSPGDEVVVTFHNVLVSVEPAPDETEEKVMVTVGDSVVGADYTKIGEITVTYPAMSLVEVELMTFTSEDKGVDVMVTYKTADIRYTENIININLPAGSLLMPMADGNYLLDRIKLTPPRVREVNSLGEGDRDEISYVTVRYDAMSTSGATGAAVSADRAGVRIIVDGDMADGDEVIVTFHNLNVAKIEDVDPGKMYKSGHFIVTDSVVGARYNEMGEEVGEIKVMPPTLSDVSVDPLTVKAGELRDKIEVTYHVEDMLHGGNEIHVEMPWDPDDGDFGDFTDSINLAEDDMDMVSSQDETAEDPPDTSYVTVKYDPAGSGRGRTNKATVTITSNEVMVMVDGDMMERDEIIVTYHGVRVDKVDGRDTESGQIVVRDSLLGSTGMYDTASVISVEPPALADVSVAQPSSASVAADATEDIQVIYRVVETLYGENEITVELPAGWEPADGDFGDFEDNIDLDGDATATPLEDAVSLVSSEDKTADPPDTSYVTVDYDPAGSGSGRMNRADVDIIGNKVSVTVDSDMMAGDRIIVTYRDAKVQGLDDTTPVKVPLTITDELSDDGLLYNVNITVSPRRVSIVSVDTTPPTVKSGEMLDTVTVTYTARDMVSDNEITISLPDDWGTPSDVTVTSNLPDNTYSHTGMRTVTVTVDGEMSVGQYIKVTFEDVEVQELADSSTAESRKITVTDKITGPSGTEYDTSALAMTVSPSSQSRVTLLRRSVTAEDMLETVTVTYIANDRVVDNVITVALPEFWGPVYGDFFTSFDGDHPSTGRDTTSYVSISGSGLRGGPGHNILHDGIRHSVRLGPISDPMRRSDRIDFTFHNVTVPQMSGITPTTAQLRVTDNVSGSTGTNYDGSTSITVNALRIGDVEVKDDTVEADGMVDLTVKYIATSTLAKPDPSATASDDGDSTYGRIMVILPQSWATASDMIYPERQPDNRDATYVTLSPSPSSGVTLREHTGSPDGLGVNGNIIFIDVDRMSNRQHLTLTVHNLKIAALIENRSERYADITAAGRMELHHVYVTSRQYSEVTERDAAFPDLFTKEFEPTVAFDETTGMGSDVFPTIKVNRKALGELDVADNEVTAGSKKDFTITYKATEALSANDVIEVRLPKNWPAPTAYDLNASDKPTDATVPNVYVSGSVSRLEGTTVSVIDGNGSGETPGTENPNGSIVRIELGSKGLPKNGTVVLNYKEVTVQRRLTSDDDLVLIEAFSGPSSSVGSLPQFPVSKQEEDKITVKHAANGSGTVTFEYNNTTVNPLASGVERNTDASVPAGTVEGDKQDLTLTYKPVGYMDTGEFEIRLPSGWNATDVLISGGGGDPTVVKSGDYIRTVTVDFYAHFGEEDRHDLEIILENITVPKDHGNDVFIARSKSKGGSLTQLSPRPRVFVGNTMADHDTVKVDITPMEAYQNQDDVDFEITLTAAAGPMHDSEIRITVPADLTGLQKGTPADPNYVKATASVAGVTIKEFDIIDEEIMILTGNLKTDGRITVRLDNVDLDGVSAAEADGFRVRTRTRGSEANLSDAGYVYIMHATDGTRTIVGGVIRTVNGSGKLVVKPALLEQSATNKDFTLTFTATTDFEKLNLVIEAPDVIETELQEDQTSGDGYVNSPHKSKLHEDDTDDDLKIENNVITWGKLTLRKGERFVTTISNVDLRDTPGDFTWETTLEDVNIKAAGGAAANPAIIVVGTLDTDVVFEIVDDTDPGLGISEPSYPAASMQSIRFRFTTVGTAIQPGGRLWFTIPVGWTQPSVTQKTGRATVSIVSKNDDDEEIFVPEITKDGQKRKLTQSGRSVFLTIGESSRLAPDSEIIIRYGDPADLKKYGVQISPSAKGTLGSNIDGLAIRGYYQTSNEAGFRQRNTETIWVDVTNVESGTGTATVSTEPTTVRAGSTHNKVTVTFTGAGTMDDGMIRLTIPEGWGPMQTDPLEPNHIAVSVSGTGAALADPGFELVGGDDMMVEVYLKTFGKGSKVTFTYGGGTGTRDKRGATAQSDIREAIFMLESKGNSADDFAEITDEASVKELNILVKGAESGSGSAEVVIQNSKSGKALYDGETDIDNEKLQVHAGDDSTYLVFTYTPSQTIADGRLRFVVPGSWTEPQDEATGDPGYTWFEELGSAQVGTLDFSNRIVTADISLTLDDQIKIHYGVVDSENGGAVASKRAGASHFVVETSESQTGAFENVDSVNGLSVQVRVQRSGGGMAEVDPMTANAGDMGSEFTITYTADGQIDNGQLKLTIPANWPAPTADNVTVKAMGSSAASVGSAMYGAGRAATSLPEGLGAMDVIVSSVALAGSDTVAFTYTPTAVQGTAGSANFAVAIDGGDGPGTGVKPVSGMTTVTVDEAARGSGTVAVEPKFVLPGSTNTLTFTYTVAGEASYPSDVRVAVPDDWTPATASNFTVSLKRSNRTRLGIVEKKGPIDGAMVARISSDEQVMAGDEIIFEFLDVTAPADAGSSEFEVTFHGQAIASSPMVRVQAGQASQLAIKAPSKVSADAGAAPARITIMIQDADGGEAAVADDVTVNLTSTSSTGSFSDADGDEVEMVTIPAGETEVEVFYSDSRVGRTARIIVEDDSGGLDGDDTSIEISTDVDAVDSITVSPEAAKAGDTVTVSAKGTPGRTVMFSVDVMPATVTNRSMTEAASGSYSGSFVVVADQHADGDYTVTVNLNDESGTASLTIDSTAPTVSASASPATVGNGDMVTITATVNGATSVTADVSALDSTKTDVALTMANGSYSASVTISDDNEAENGSKTITVEAMDAAGNSASAEAMVTLDNKKSFTSMIPAGISLFHVPLDVDGLDTVGDLKTMLGDAVDLAIVYDSATGSWNSRSDAVAITSSLGIILSMSAEATVTFDGDTWDGGVSTISLQAGANLIGLPVNDARVTNISDIAGLAVPAGIVSTVVVSTDDGFKSVGAAGDAGDGPVMGDAAYLVTASAAGNIALTGDGWTYAPMGGAAPVALPAFNVEGQTVVLDVHGAVVDEITGLAREGFRVKVKNLSTKAALNKVTSAEMAGAYNMTFVDLKAGNAARIGDVLEISADSPNPLFGVQPVRHVVTVDDVKNSTISLEDLIAYEIPAETELLRNYPNPFNPETWIPYYLAEDADVNLRIYDINGELVRDIDVGHQTAAKYDTRAKAIYWDGRNSFGEQVASGIYFYSLSAGDFSATRKMVILK